MNKRGAQPVVPRPSAQLVGKANLQDRMSLCPCVTLGEVQTPPHREHRHHAPAQGLWKGQQMQRR